MTKKFLSCKGIPFKINIEEEVAYVETLKADGFRQTPVVAIEDMPKFSGSAQTYSKDFNNLCAINEWRPKAEVNGDKLLISLL